MHRGHYPTARSRVRNLVVTTSASKLRIPLSIEDIFKRIFLGKPLISDDLEGEKLSNPVALGALSPDAISSTAYGTEQILIELLPAAGLAAFALLLPITGVILVILVLVTASYRQVVMAYTRAGGSYIVARENFGPRVAQIAAAALLIDYVVTVAVQAAAGTVAVVSALPALGPYSLTITVGVVILICYANLRGLREAGRPFAVPTYFFITMIILTIVTGVVRAIFGDLPVYDSAHMAGTVDVHQGNGLVMGATVLVLLRAFANGGSSLTGVEAISNTVTVFRKPQGRNARRGLTAMACILGFLLAGVPYLAHVTHATPYVAGYPSVLSEIGRAVFGHGVVGDVFYVLVQTSTAAILFTGANTSFNGFPALASFVAEDRFLPRQLMKRAHGVLGGVAGYHRWFSQRAGPVLCDRRVHRILDGRLRDDQASSDSPGTRLARPAGDQPVRGDPVDDRGRHLRGGEVHRGGVAGGRCFSGAGVHSDTPESGISRRGRHSRDVPHRPPRLGEVRTPPGVRLRQLS